MYLYETGIEYCNKPTPVFGPDIKVANGNIMVPKSQTQVKLSPHLSKEAQHGYIFNDLATGSLISIGQLCDNNCIALFSKYTFKITKNKMVIFEGKCNQSRL